MHNLQSALCKLSHCKLLIRKDRHAGWHDDRMMRPEVAGIGLSLPDRLPFPAAGTPKLVLARYYETVPQCVHPPAVDRPLTLGRSPSGAPQNGSPSTPAS